MYVSMTRPTICTIYMLLPINNLPKVYLEDQAQKENQERKHFTYCTIAYDNIPHSTVQKLVLAG